MVSILPILVLPLVCPGKMLLMWQTWNWTFSLILISTCSSRKRSGEGWQWSTIRYARGNVPDMENYDVSKRNSYIIYLDATNLYGWVMSQPLPTSNFKWLTDKEIKDIDVMMIADGSSRGYILECDYFYFLSKYLYFIKSNASFLCVSEYPYGIHDLRKDYPLAPERLRIEENILSNCQSHLLQDEGFSKTQPKFSPNLRNKTNYIIHYCNFSLYLKVGLHLTNAHRVLSFDQSPWLKNFNQHQLQYSATYSCKKWFWKRFL